MSLRCHKDLIRWYGILVLAVALSVIPQSRGSDPLDPGSTSVDDEHTDQVVFAPILDDDARKLSFQALLSNTDGTPLPGPTVNLEFNIYDADGGLVEGPITLVAAIDTGVVSTQIPVTASSFNGAGRELGVKVNGGAELSPRVPLTAVPYAFRVNRVSSEELDDLIDLGAGGSDAARGRLRAYNYTGYQTVALDGAASHGGGMLVLYGPDGTADLRLALGSSSATGWGQVLLYNDIAAPTVEIDGGSPGADFIMSDGTWPTVNFSAGDSGSGAELRLSNGSSADGRAIDTISLSAKAYAGGAQVRLFASDGTISHEMTAGNSEIKLFDSAGQETIRMTGDQGGSGWISTDVLQINGGADLAEQFDIVASPGGVTSGMVVCIDADHPGKLAVSAQAYDRKVAGIVSGAGDLKPGMLMGQRGTAADGDYPVALTGRVWAWCDASSCSIAPGDMLTTSDTPGHAMKVADFGRAHGAVLGKAMTPLKEGRGLVLVLVSLQ